jgi:diguanylate cyclase (GGDEF)-like protein
MDRILQKLDSIFGQHSATRKWAIPLVLLGLISATGYLVGYEITVSLFLLIPIALTTWYGSYRNSVIMCFLSAFIWYLVDIGSSSGHPFNNPFAPYWNSAIRLGLFLITVQLLIQLKASLNSEKELSRTDNLTGAMNKRGFNEVAEKMFELAARHIRPTSIAYIDLDNFKKVNDEFGHFEGDKVLKTVGDILLKSVRRSDVVGRLGGDEFSIILPETNEIGAKSTFLKLKGDLALAMKEHNWPIGFSIGVVSFDLPPARLDEAIRSADELMYHVKRHGKNDILFKHYQSEKKIPTDFRRRINTLRST